VLQPAPQEKKEATILTFRSPVINLYSRDLFRAVAFYRNAALLRLFALRHPANRSKSNSQSMGSPSDSRPWMQRKNNTTFDREEKGAGSKSSFGPTTLMSQ
jgi:hypothetical protein